MANTPFILMLDEPQWRLGVVCDESPRCALVAHREEASLADRVKAVGVLLDAEGCAKREIVLGLPATRCLTGAIDTAALPRSGRNEAMRYALEEYIPMAVEDLATCFIQQADAALGIGTQASALAAVIEAFEVAGIDVTAVTATDVLALQGAPITKGADLALLQTADDRVSVFAMGALGQSQPSSWWWIDDKAAALRQAIGRYAAERGEMGTIRVGAAGLSEVNLAALRAIDEVELVGVETFRSDDMAVRALHRSGQRKTLAVDFLPSLNELAESPMGASVSRGILIAALLLAIAAPAALLLRAGQYNRVAADQRAQQAAHYEAYFQRPAPAAGMVRHFSSELNQARMGLSTTHRAAAYPSALSLMRHTLELFPADAKVAITRFEFSPNQLRIDGQAAQNEDAYALEKALGALHQLSPRVEQIQDSGARDRKRLFTLTANPDPAPGVSLRNAAAAPEVVHSHSNTDGNQSEVGNVTGVSP